MRDKLANRAITAVVLGILLLPLFASCSRSQASVPEQPLEVKRGDLDINVTSDGTLITPDDFKLAFGTQGVVRKILVEEGDEVGEGGLLAMLDNKAQKDARSNGQDGIKPALLSIQTAQNNIAFGCGIDHLPYNYADLSVSRMADEAKKDISTAANYFRQAKYKDAGYWLIMTYFDIEVCQELITSRPNAAELAGAKANTAYYPDVAAGSSAPLSLENQHVVDYLQQFRQKLLDISGDMRKAGAMKAGVYEKIAAEFDAAEQETVTASQMAKSTISVKDRFVFKYADTPSSVDFLQSSLRSLQEVEEYLPPDNADLTDEAIDNLYIAKLKLQIARDVLQNQTLVFESGGSINWKTLQQYNLSLQSAEIALYKAKRAIMQTVIIAPTKGTIKSVNLKVNYSLSAIDFSSRPAVELVSTSRVRFQGTVDEIDIMKVKTGQKANITIDAITDKVFTGTVKFISPYGAKAGNVIKFAIQISLDPTDSQLRGGLNATANIMAASVKNALLVPVSVIINTPNGPMVTVVNEATGASERKRVTLGIQNFQFAEVLSGLKEGDKVRMASWQGTTTLPNTQSGPRTSNPMRVLR